MDDVEVVAGGEPVRAAECDDEADCAEEAEAVSDPFFRWRTIYQRATPCKDADDGAGDEEPER